MDSQWILESEQLLVNISILVVLKKSTYISKSVNHVIISCV